MSRRAEAVRGGGGGGGERGGGSVNVAERAAQPSQPDEQQRTVTHGSGGVNEDVEELRRPLVAFVAAN